MPDPNDDLPKNETVPEKSDAEKPPTQVIAPPLYRDEDHFFSAKVVRTLSRVEVDKLFNDALEPYAKELGLLLYAWNDLHIKLTHLYLAVCEREDGAEQDRDILLAIWNAIPNDRLQRNMLRNAAKVRFGRLEKRMQEIGVQIDLIKDNERSQLDEILWILEKADLLGRKRDDSAHVPMEFHLDESVRLLPMDDLGHPIAEQLSGKDIVALFSLYRARIDVINNHAAAMWMYLLGGDAQPSLPQKPVWPESPPPSGRKA